MVRNEVHCVQFMATPKRFEAEYILKPSGSHIQSFLVRDQLS
jgi:hypothetical protein